ncbi:hypothetical protein GGI00_004817, partial [Coemansia sp. RSA 2681]
ESEDDNPQPLSGADTFRTARGAPMFSSAESPVAATTTADAGGSSSSDQPAQETLQKPAADPASGIAELERRLYDVCIEIDEWRRTRHIQDFVGEYTESGADAAGSGGGGRRRRQQRGSRPLSIRSAGLSTRLPIEQIIDEARERHRMRASSLGNAAAPAAGFMAPLRDAAAPSSSLMLSASPPLSRLMQAEREAADLRATRNGYSSPPPCPPTIDGALSPSGQPCQDQLSSLRLIGNNINSGAIGGDDDSRNSAARRDSTLADDVRIIGWVTRGSGLDVHTEFKVVVHLTRGENLTIMRRYTDFAMLREVLCQRFYTFRKRIPHLPPKKAFGKFEDKFLKERESGLQFFLAYVMLHPVIGRSSIIKQWLQGGPTAATTSPI